MKAARRNSWLWFIGIFAVTSVALGYDYLFVYDPPIRTVEKFEKAMSWGDIDAIRPLIVISSSIDLDKLHEPTDAEIRQLLGEPFQKGRILDLRKRVDEKGEYQYVVYRTPDGHVYALMVTKFGKQLRVMIADRQSGAPTRYLWDFNWTN